MRQLIKMGCLFFALVFGFSTFAMAEAKTAILIADFSCGKVEGDYTKQLEMPYEGELDALILAQGLSDWSGLDFTIDQATLTEDHGLIIDWSEYSTLIHGLDDREQKEEFHFYDAESLNWFMMDSLYHTLMENLDVSEVYYTMEGGESLFVGGGEIWEEFDADLPYMASQFYYAHYDVRGDSPEDSEEEEYGELGYDDEAGYRDPYYGFVESMKLEGQEMELFQRTSNGQAIREGIALDGIVAITNCTFEPVYDLNTLSDEAVCWAVMATDRLMVGEKPTVAEAKAMLSDFQIVEDEKRTNKTSYPSYIASWTSGSNEDTRQNEALITLMDSGSLMYRFGISIDHLEDVAGKLDGIWDGLSIEVMKDE